MGTPDFAVATLETLIKSHHEVVAVYTQPDKPFGRGKIIKASEVKVKAIEEKIPVYQPNSLKGSEEIVHLTNLEPDVIVVVAYGQILPKEILEIPKYGCINVHASLLPRYRGASPIQTSILNGDDVTGITTMYMSEELDTGDIIDFVETNIGENETASELFERLAPIGAKLLEKTLSEIESGSVSCTPQDENKASYAPILTKKMAKINFNMSARCVHKFICGLSDWPCAYCCFEGKKLKIYKSILNNEYFGKPGEILDNKKFIVGCESGAVEFIEVQLEGKKKMSARDFLNGNSLKKGKILD